MKRLKKFYKEHEWQIPLWFFLGLVIFSIYQSRQDHIRHIKYMKKYHPIWVQNYDNDGNLIGVWRTGKDGKQYLDRIDK